MPILLDIVNPFGQAPVYFVRETGSTMEEAAALLERDVPSGSVIRAGFQSRGRGRVPGRSWTADPDGNLLFTLILSSDYFPYPLPRVPLLCGLALSRYFRAAFDLDPKIKWPNDVLIGGRKVSGVLCEARDGWVLIGIGVNCNQSTFPPEIAAKAASLSLLTGRRVDTTAMLAGVLALLRDTFDEAVSGSGWRESIERSLYRIGERISFMSGLPDAPVETAGKILGLNADGALVVLPDGSREPVSCYSGEIAFL